MPKKTFTEEKLTASFKKAESGVRVADVFHQTGVTEMTFCPMKRSFAVAGLAEVRRLRVWDEEGRNEYNQ